MRATPSVVLFGELLLRLNAEGFSRLVQADRFQVYYTGAEANAGASLVNWGYEALVVSRVPSHEIGQACVNFLRRYGLDPRYVQRAGDRIGIFYVENGASQRQSKVIYDRRDSAFTTFDDSTLDWDEVFRGRRWFHFAGTAPAVAPRLVPVLERACTAARRHGVTVSCDLNFRRKLWTPEQARATMPSLMKLVDVLICNEEDAEMVFGIKARNTDVRHGRLSREDYEDVARQLEARFGFSHVAITLRESHSASVNTWSALLLTGGTVVFSKPYQIQIVDRIGGGDAFAAGLIHGVCEGMPAQDTVEFAVAASCLKHTIPGDFNLVSREEVLTLAAGDGSGRIQR
jgi:2-dehydro-3-deoxygluconokinase